MPNRFTIPGWQADHQAKQAQAERDWYYSRREVPGPTYQMEPPGVYGDRHAGEPHPHGVPPEYDRPPLIDLLPSAPRTLAVSQEVEHGQESRDEEFWRSIQQAADLGRMHKRYGLSPEVALGPWVYRDRRISGRRHRPTFNGDDEAGIPYPPAPHGSEIPYEKYLRGW
jgi:hypothetical protein